MVDPATVSGALTSIKTAFEIAKLMRASDSSLEKAEVKLKLAEMISALADAKMEVVQIQDDLSAKDERIRALEEALETKATLVRANDALYRAGSEGKPTGDPYCIRCWEADHALRQLVMSAGGGSTTVCPTCKTFYERRMTGSYRT